MTCVPQVWGAQAKEQCSLPPHQALPPLVLCIHTGITSLYSLLGRALTAMTSHTVPLRVSGAGLYLATSIVGHGDV